LAFFIWSICPCSAEISRQRSRFSRSRVAYSFCRFFSPRISSVRWRSRSWYSVTVRVPVRVRLRVRARVRGRARARVRVRVRVRVRWRGRSWYLVASACRCFCEARSFSFWSSSICSSESLPWVEAASASRCCTADS